MESEWLIVLSAEARLAWVQLLCYTKTHGLAGRVKVKPTAVFARQSYLGEESVEQMIRAAKADGALEESDGDWVITGWGKHQGDETGAQRQKRYREARNKTSEVFARDGYRCVACGSVDDLCVDHIIPVSRGGDTVLSNLQTLCGTCNRKKGNRANSDANNALRRDSNVKEKRGEENRDIPTCSPSLRKERQTGSHFKKPTAEEVAEYAKEIELPMSEARGFFDYQESKGWIVGKVSMKDWRASLRTWKGNWLKMETRKPTSKPSFNEDDWEPSGEVLS
jgi:5-methylcytosine-specific restriction endonuclease McrA